jgi:hypothetical protein
MLIQHLLDEMGAKETIPNDSNMNHWHRFRFVIRVSKVPHFYYSGEGRKRYSQQLNAKTQRSKETRKRRKSKH